MVCWVTPFQLIVHINLPEHILLWPNDLLSSYKLEFEILSEFWSKNCQNLLLFRTQLMKITILHISLISTTIVIVILGVIANTSLEIEFYKN